jgi:hypothetical protein
MSQSTGVWMPLLMAHSMISEGVNIPYFRL